MTAPKNPKPIGLPVSIPAAEALANLEKSRQIEAERAAKRAGRSVVVNALSPVRDGAFPQPAVERPARRSEREALAARASYLVGDTTPSGVDLSVKDLPGPLLLEVTDIDVYDHNPRLFANEKIEDIEASLRASGFHDALVVTRRREGERYMLAAGSNTTLRVLQELWRATRDEKYRWVNCVYQPYERESRLLAQHLGENLNRGDMRFWEVARGMVDLLDQLDADALREGRAAKPMGLREQSDALAAMGLRASKTQVALWRFATQHLGPLGEALEHLTYSAVQGQLQPRTNALRALAAKFTQQGIDDQRFWREIITPVLERHSALAFDGTAADGLDAGLLCDSFEAALAEQVGESVATIRQMLSLLQLSPALTLADLRTPSPSLVVTRDATPVSLVPAKAPPGAAAAGPAPCQPPLPLGPGLVHRTRPGQPTAGPCADSVGGPKEAPPSSAGAITAAAEPAVAQSAFEARQLAAHPAGDTAGCATADAAAEVDALKALHSVVERLLSDIGLRDTLRWWEDMPMGFFVELPDPALHPRRRLLPGTPEYDSRTVKTAVWWSLVLMSGQFREGCVPFIDQSSGFFRAYACEHSDNPLHGTDIDQAAPDLEEMLMFRLRPGPMRKALLHLRAIEDAAARMFEQRPERWRRMLEVQRLA